MEELPRFSLMLKNRREDLGLTLTQASRVLKLREQVLQAFEEGDFANIPQSGYAQGMLSSYARYLGLNPRELVDQFQEDLYENQHGFSSHDLRRRTRESRSLSPDSSGFFPALVSRRAPEPRRSAQEESSTDLYDTTSTARLRSDALREASHSLSSLPYVDEETQSFSVYPQTRTSQVSASSRTSAQGAYTQRESAQSGYSALSRAHEQSTSAYPQGRPYTSQSTRSEVSASRSRAIMRDQQRTTRARYSLSEDEGFSGRRGTNTNVVTRDARESQFVDDLVVENEARPYEAASSWEARAGMRAEAPQRPRVQRRQSSRMATSERTYNQRQRSVFSDSRNAMLVILGILALVLIVTIALSIRSCVSGYLSNGRRVDIVSSTEQTQDESTTSSNQDQAEGTQNSTSETPSSTEETPESSDASTQETDEQSTQDATPERVDVTVSVEEGQVSWVEISCDGSSLVAETITGPWETSFSVTRSATVSVGVTSAVSVTRNGELVRFEERTSGVGMLTIQGSGAADPIDITTEEGQDSPVTQEGSAETSG